MTAAQRHALAVLHDADPRYGGEAVRTSGATHRCDGQAWINWRTARALERRGLVVCEGHGEEATVRLTESRGDETR